MSEKPINSTYISTPSRTMEILKHFDITLRKTYGQNFLIDTNVLKKIAGFAGLNEGDIVLEIGSGIGSLTEIIYQHTNKIIAVEIDNALSTIFKQIFKDFLNEKILLIKNDAMKINYFELASLYGINKCVSNFPYKIAAPVLLKILSETDRITDFFITIQKDIAERILAKPGDKNYNAFSVKLNFYSHFVRSFSISRSCFYPKPFVDSVTIHLKRNERFLPNEILYKINPLIVSDILKNHELQVSFTQDFFRFVEDCFYHRRKKLLNSLNLRSQFYKNNEGKIIKVLEKYSLSKDSRPEELSLEVFIFLFLTIKDEYSYFLKKHDI
jgi:16S rRNA (adenine1518-N6/adenine1519-N6)-dimethyltransferase